MTHTWQEVSLGEVGQSLIGLTYSPANVRRDGTLVLRSSNIQGGQLAFDDNVYVDAPIPEKIRIRQNDILICVRNGSRRLIGKSVMLDSRVVGETFGAFMAVYRSDLNPFLQYFFQSDDFKRQIDEHLGATINQITNGSLNSFTVTLPSLPEQQAIVKTLKDADALIDALRRLLVKKRAIKHGILQQLLSGRTRLPGFTDPWTSVQFDSVALVSSDRAMPQRVDPGTRLIELEHVEGGTGRVQGWSTASVAGSLKARFEPGDVLFGKLRAYLRKYWLADGSGLCSTEFWVLRPRAGYASGYLRYLVESEEFIEAASGGFGTHMPRADWGVVRKLRFSVPALQEQESIARGLLDADAEISAVRARLAKAQSLKQGLIQQLLTGRSRVTVEDAA